MTIKPLNLDKWGKLFLGIFVHFEGRATKQGSPSHKGEKGFLFVVLPVQFSNLFIEDLRKLANMAA